MDCKNGILLLMGVLRVRAVVLKVEVGLFNRNSKGAQVSERSLLVGSAKEQGGGLTRLSVCLKIENVGYGGCSLRWLIERDELLVLDCCLIRVCLDVWVIRLEKRRYVDALGLFFVDSFAKLHRVWVYGCVECIE